MLTVNQTSLTFDYLPDTLDLSAVPAGSPRYRSVVVSDLSLDPSYWHHLAVTVFEEDAAFFVNGSLAAVQLLEGRMVDSVDRDLFLGQLIANSEATAGTHNGSACQCLHDQLALLPCKKFNQVLFPFSWLLQRSHAGDVSLYTGSHCPVRICHNYCAWCMHTI